MASTFSPLPVSSEPPRPLQPPPPPPPNPARSGGRRVIRKRFSFAQSSSLQECCHTMAFVCLLLFMMISIVLLTIYLSTGSLDFSRSHHSRSHRASSRPNQVPSIIPIVLQLAENLVSVGELLVRFNLLCREPYLGFPPPSSSLPFRGILFPKSPSLRARLHSSFYSSSHYCTSSSPFYLPLPRAAPLDRFSSELEQVNHNILSAAQLILSQLPPEPPQEAKDPVDPSTITELLDHQLAKDAEKSTPQETVYALNISKLVLFGAFKPSPFGQQTTNQTLSFFHLLMDIESSLVFLSQAIVKLWQIDPKVMFTPSAEQASGLADQAQQLTAVVLVHIAELIEGDVTLEVTSFSSKPSLDPISSSSSDPDRVDLPLPPSMLAPIQHTSLLAHRLAIIVPLRNRELHAEQFVKAMHDRSKQAPLSFASPKVFLIEQMDALPFNRGKLLNIGFMEALRHGQFDYFAFHDVDMLPLTDEVDYSYPANLPRHLATCVEQFSWKMPYPRYFGGVTLLNLDQMIRTNGYSNRFWGWGGEDDDFYLRIRKSGYRIDRREPHCTFGVFRSLEEGHVREVEDALRNEKLSFFDTFWYIDGLSNLNYYKHDETIHQTHIRIHVYLDVLN